MTRWANNGSRSPFSKTFVRELQKNELQDVTNGPSRKSFRVVSDRGVALIAALRLLGGHLRPEEHSPRAASRAAFAANAEAAPPIAREHVPVLRAPRPIARDKRATRRCIRKGQHSSDAGEQLGATSAAQRRNRVTKTAKPRATTT